MQILVCNNNNGENENKVVSNEIICPTCKENTLINLRDFQIDLHGCKNRHKIENISLYEFENSQKIDLSTIICDECRINNRSNSYNHKFYFCNTCEKNLCPVCESKHDKNHNIINYEDKNYLCKKHNDKYIQFCKQRKGNICFSCKNYHNNHSFIELVNLVPNKDELLKGMNYMRQLINKFKNNIEEIKKIINKVLDNIEIYY